ncbi:DNA cytosine methyltransferase [Thalassotalea sp. PS06]|uniref:DNA cytosine methyltransferase n=1 Tax=Thalassotalea sp. PS06 TaxID=2594005 RepID=UPI001162313A|nr:DNA cytosine methyltransferase [Thalassotalea sp. PS06]QDP02767.1 DNA cytosine methyltransferase [Thalassotalea sp. PS06]
MLNTIDLFAGCGGLTEGFKQSGGYKMLAAVEWDKDAHSTLQNRLATAYGYENPEDCCILFDIRETQQLINGIKSKCYPVHPGLDGIIKKQKVDVIIGGPPCQAYSVAGRIRDANGMHDDYRNFLFESYMKVVDHYQPDAFIFENVPGMLSAAPGGISITDRITETFNNSGYIISGKLKEQALFDTSEFGVPQKRKRVIIAAFRKKSFSDALKKVDLFYRYLNEQKSDKVMTVESAFKGLPKLYPLSSPDTRKSHQQVKPTNNIVSDHNPRFHNQRDIEIFRLLAEDIETKKYKYTSSTALQQLYTERTGKSSSVHKYHVLRTDSPSNTIPAHLYKDGLRHIHPDSRQARSITVREAARLQSFPDDFEFLGSNGSKYKMIGNAVPPNFAKKISLALAKSLQE